MRTDMTATLVIDACMMAVVRKRPSGALVFHSDPRGSILFDSLPRCFRGSPAALNPEHEQKG